MSWADEVFVDARAEDSGMYSCSVPARHETKHVEFIVVCKWTESRWYAAWFFLARLRTINGFALSIDRATLLDDRCSFDGWCYKRVSAAHSIDSTGISLSERHWSIVAPSSKSAARSVIDRSAIMRTRVIAHSTHRRLVIRFCCSWRWLLDAFFLYFFFFVLVVVFALLFRIFCVQCHNKYIR